MAQEADWRCENCLMTPGWTCPVCHKGNAPHADKCGHCAEVTVSGPSADDIFRDELAATREYYRKRELPLGGIRPSDGVWIWY